MRIDKLFKQKKPILSFEIFPPRRDTSITSIDETLEILSKLNPDFISVTFGAGGTTTNNLTVELAKKIKHQYHIEPLVHLTCLNYTIVEIESILNELKENDISNVLALRGDKNIDIKPKEEFHYASDLIKYIKGNNNFGISAACYPECHLESRNRIEDILYLKQKIDMGATHLISQLFFDNSVFYSFIENIRIAGIEAPVEAGIMPVINKTQIERMINLCGASLPMKFRCIIEKYEDNKDALFDAGIAYAVSQIVDLLAHNIDGVHIYTMNNPKVAKKICDGIKNLI